MIKVLGIYKEQTFEYFYMFVMVIYMAQMTPDTGRMIGGLSGNPVPFLIPIVLTLILLSRHAVEFSNKRLGQVLMFTTLWSVCIVVKERLYSTQELSYIFFLYYAIIIAYIHCQVFGRRLRLIYEDIMVVFAMISVPLWLFAVLMPSAATYVFHHFPETGFGNNFFYLFDWMDPVKGQKYAILRNAGCSWEPGRFSIMLTLAICFNLLRNGVRFNKNVFWLLLSLATTQSTTGYSIVIFLYALFVLKRISTQYVIGFVFLFVPVAIGVFQIDFMTSKIQNHLEVVENMDVLNESFDYSEKVMNESEYAASLDRFESMYLESFNIAADPVLGYGRNTQHSYFSRNVSSHFGLTGGLLKLFGQMGIPFALYLYYILYKSSAVIGDESNMKRRIAVFFSILMSSVSYLIFTIPVFTAFWFYSMFKKEE